MMTKSFSNREKVLLIILVVLVIAAAYYMLVLQPTTTAINTAQSEIDELKDLVAIEEAKANLIASMQKELEEIAGTPAKYAITPIYDNFQNLLDELNRALAYANDYKLNFVAPAIADGIAKRELQLVFYSDDYYAAKNIVSLLYAGPYRCDITSLKIVPQDSHAVDLTDTPVTVTMTIAYYELFKDAS